MLNLYQVDADAIYWMMARSKAEALGLLLVHQVSVECKPGVELARFLLDEELSWIRELTDEEAAKIPFDNEEGTHLRTMLEVAELHRDQYNSTIIEKKELDAAEAVIACGDW